MFLIKLESKCADYLQEGDDLRIPDQYRSCTMLVVVVYLLLSAGAAGFARAEAEAADDKPTIDELVTRISALEAERELAAIAFDDGFDKGPTVGVFDGIELDLGGFVTQTLTVAHGKDNTAVSPNQTLLELLIRATVTERVSVFAALGWLREADLDLKDPESPEFRPQANRTPQIIAWTNYRHSDAIQLRIGRFVTPHGIINIEHFPPTLLEINQPQFLRPFPGATLFPNFMSGAEIHGRLHTKAGTLSHSLFGGIYSGAPEEWIVGGRLASSVTDLGLTFGLNASTGARDAGADDMTDLANFSTVPVLSTRANNFSLVGADVLFDRGRFLVKNEVFYSFESKQPDRFGFYTQPAFRITEKWIAFYRFDYLDPGQGKEFGTSTEHVVGVNFLPHHLVRIRGSVFFKEDIDANKKTTIGQLSLTVSF